LNRRLIETWLGIQQSVIDQAINQWRVCLNACFENKRKAFWTHAMCDMLFHNETCITVFLLDKF